MLCDLSDDKVTMAREKYPHTHVTQRPEDVLDNPDIDVVSIASYDDGHHEQAVRALRNGKHVFVEKPLCLHEHEAREIRMLLSANPRLRLSSNLILRMCPRFRLLRQMIRNGDFGRLFYLEGDYNYGRLHKLTQGWRGRLPFYSVTYGGGVHMVDLLLWLADAPVTEVAAQGNRVASAGSGFRYNDFAVALLRFEGGVIGKVAANFGCVCPHFHRLTVYGTEATFENGPESGLLYRSREAAVAPERITAAYPGVQKGDLIGSFVDSILKGEPAEVTTEHVFRAMSVCFAIEKAVQASAPVAVEYL